MHRLLVPFLLVAAVAVPASAQQDQICATVKTRGSVPPNTETNLACRTVPYRYGMYCESGSTGVHPDVWVEHYYCGPTLIPFLS